MCTFFIIFLPSLPLYFSFSLSFNSYINICVSVCARVCVCVDQLHWEYNLRNTQ